MKFSTKTGAVAGLKTDCLVVGMLAGKEQNETTTAVDKATGGLLSRMAEQGDLATKAGAVTMLHTPAGLAATRLAVVGLGKTDELVDTVLTNAAASVQRALAETKVKSVLFALGDVAMNNRDAAWKAAQIVRAVYDAAYRFDDYKSTAAPTAALREVQLHALTADQSKVAKGIEHGRAVAAGSALARDLGNLPGNVCTPTYLAETARKLATEHKLKVEVLDRKQMQALGMNTLLSVAAGSHEPPKFIVLKHLKGAAKSKPVVLVGKGITFDTGGISLKPGPEMDEMKYDMCGAASVLGAMKTAAMLDLPMNLIAVVPATENMPGGGATRPGDIVKSMSGQTVEILNTDAEGRLILCDALTFVERFDPECVVDVATLTGACVIALGHVATGLLANNQELADELLACGKNAGDRAWQMPLWDDYQDLLKSNFADMANIGGRAGGTITAACFLARFTKKYPWAHLDIAGTAWKSGKEKGATGRPVPLLADFLVGRATAAAALSKAPAKATSRKRA